jgi:hypothetical protein
MHYGLLLFILNFFSCQNQKDFGKESLIGVWESTNNRHPKIKLKFHENEVTRYENGNRIRYDGFRVDLDTLEFIKGRNSEKHLIKNLRKDLIKFSLVNPNDVDIELIDILEFRKVK